MKLLRFQVFGIVGKKQKILSFSRKKGTKSLDFSMSLCLCIHILNKNYACEIATATATEAPTIGLLPIPINPIIST